jgi:hypothetical protein
MLRGWLRNWLEESKLVEQPLDLTVEAWIIDQGTRQCLTFEAQGVKGLHLLCTTKDGSGIHLISKTQTVDKEHFQKVWNAFCAQSKVSWANGSEYKP